MPSIPASIQHRAKASVIEKEVQDSMADCMENAKVSANYKD